jgi:hypothetical protein
MIASQVDLVAKVMGTACVADAVSKTDGMLWSASIQWGARGDKTLQSFDAFAIANGAGAACPITGREVVVGFAEP